MDNFNQTEKSLITLSKTMSLFLGEEKTADLIALYTFYYYTSMWQKTKQIKVTTDYTAEKLKWTVNKVRKIKKELKRLNLIEDIIKRDRNNRIKGHFIGVKEAE